MLSETEIDKFVLVVCHANICRSPIAHFWLQQRLAESGWTVFSRGTHAREDGSMCAEGAAWISSVPGGSDFVPAFPVEQLSQADTRAALVLTASTKERSLVSRLSPATRNRVFTLAEAAELAAAVPDLTLADSGPAAVAAHLDEIRRSGMLPQAMSPDAMEIRDPHFDSRVQHKETFSTIVNCIDRLVGAIKR